MFDQAFTGNVMFPLGIKHKIFLHFIIQRRAEGEKLVTNNGLMDVCNSKQHTKEMHNGVIALWR